MLLCTFLGAVGATIFLLGKERWAEVDPQEPEKVFAREVLQVVNAKMPWAPPNGSRVQAMANRVWMKFASRNNEHGELHGDKQNGMQNGVQSEPKDERELP